MNWYLKIANQFELTRDLNNVGIPPAPAASLGKTIHDTGGGDELRDILNDVQLIKEEKQWRKAMQTVGARVRHDKEGWEGTIWRPLTGNGSADEMVGVEHPFTDGGTTIMAKRFYRPTELSPVNG